MNEEKITKDVRDFYNQIGWQMVDSEHYQNAQYEDLRPVSREYIHCCHMRVKRHLAPSGQYLLDAGSGPVQYPEYLTYSEDYCARVCMDISIQALKEARLRLGGHGLYVVADIAFLPFVSNQFDGVVSLHTIHHLPMKEKLKSYQGLFRVLRPGKTIVIVEGWTNAPLMKRLSRFEHLVGRFRTWWNRQMHKEKAEPEQKNLNSEMESKQEINDKSSQVGTFVEKLDSKRLKMMLEGRMDYDILVWRSVSVSFLRAVIHQDWGGRFWLKLLFWLEERFPRFFGRMGQYPLIIVNKPVTKET